jgi:hypothetical protein
VVVQTIGLLCMCTWQIASAPIASFLWGTATVALFPGNLASTVLIEKLFWNSHWTSMAMLAAELPALIAINAVFWFGLARAMQLVSRGQSR